MKYSKLLKRMVVPEWSDFYLNYSVLKKLLGPAKLTDELFLKASIDGDEGEVSNISTEDLERLNKFSKKFEELIMRELNKVAEFYKMKMKELLKTWRKIKLNSILVKRSKQKPDYDQRKNLLKNCFQVYYKELRLLSDFLTVNLEGFKKIFKKFNKHSKKFDPKNNLKALFEERLRDIHIHYHKESIQNLISHVETDYLEIFYSREDGRKRGQEELRKINQGKQVSDRETFYFGFFLGLCFSIIMLIVFISWMKGLTADKGKFKEIFPTFRGIGILILYIWLLAWNVYGWTNNNINYKLIFGFTYHYSTVSEILGRAAMFTACFLIFFLWYILSIQDFGIFGNFLEIFPPSTLPLIIWLLFFGYLLFPSINYFNGHGRLYMFHLFKEVVLSPIHSNNTFRVFWATDQLASFVVPFMDFEYLFCFYSTGQCVFESYSNTAVFIAIIPLLLRMIQCGRLIYDTKIVMSRPFWNGLKYLTSVIAVTISYLYGVSGGDNTYFHYWMVNAIIITIASYIWDLKMDWGFLVKDSKHYLLRNDLSYTNPKIYYYGRVQVNSHFKAMIANFIFRICWILSISPAIIDKFSQPELVTAIVGMGEIVRRSVWNFLRVEKEHIQNCGSFKAVNDYTFPYDKIEINFDEKLLFQNELNQIQEAEQEDDNFEMSNTNADDSALPEGSPSNTIPIKKVKKTQSWLNLAGTDVNQLKLDAKEIENIKLEVKQYKEYIEQRAKKFKVITFMDHRTSMQEMSMREPLLSRVPSAASILPRNASSNEILPRISSNIDLVSRLSKPPQRPS